MSQTFSNHDFNVVKNGLSSTYSINNHPYKETFMSPTYKLSDYGTDDFTIKCCEKINGRNKQFKIRVF